MGLTHKLIYTHSWIEKVIQNVDTSESVLFRDALPNHIDPTTGELEQTLYVDQRAEQLAQAGDLLSSQSVYLTAGNWRLNEATSQHDEEVELFWLPDGIYTDYETVESMGVYAHNDIIEIADDGRYIIASDTGGFPSYLQSEVITFVKQDTVETDIPHTDVVTTVIDEPIGFDKMQVEFKRHDMHGIGAEVSAGTLEFYNSAFNAIKDAYEADIDSDLRYEVKTDSSEVVYSGQVDLSTCSFKRAEYESVSVKVGDVGSKTTFNNRTDVDIDLNVPKTVDGADVESPTWRKLQIPIKHLLYTNLSQQKVENKMTGGGGSSTSTGGILITSITTSTPYVFLPIGDDGVVEFGALTQQNPPYTTDDINVVDPQYLADEEHVQKYGSGTRMALDIVCDFKMEVRDLPTAVSVDRDATYLTFKLKAVFKTPGREATVTANGVPVKKYKSEAGGTGIRGAYYFKPELHIDTDYPLPINAGWAVKYYLEVEDVLNFHEMTYITMLTDSYVKMKMVDTISESDPVKTGMVLVHDALNVVSHAISENALAVKSDWYRTPESQWNAGSTGGGATKALTNGYKIRNLVTDDNHERNMPLSFKTMMQSLEALDCVGWGFSNENNVECVRVERWDWFYKSDVVLSLTNVADVTTEVLTDRIPTELEIGYKKYATVDQYNSIDSPHGTRTFVNGIKALNKGLTKLSEFIADNYAIEETRRARTQKSSSEETTYDSNVFLFELVRAYYAGSYSIGHTSINPKNVGTKDEFINAKLTPRHMAARWRDFLFATNNTTPFRFTSGEINYTAEFSCMGVSPAIGGVRHDSLEPFSITSPQAENDDITFVHAKFDAEKITFEYPLTLAQYKSIKANPYGLIGVNGRYGWITDFKYTFATGKANFTLIAKHTT